MYSLTITIVSIALAVVMLASMLFHGGDTLTEGRAAAVASSLVNEGSQVQVAYKMNMAIGSQEHMTVPQLVARGYLKNAPPLYDVDWGWGLFAPGTKQGFAGAVLLTSALPKVTNDDGGLRVCNALEKMAGRPAKNNLLEFQTAIEGELPGRFGCMQGDVLTIYYKM